MRRTITLALVLAFASGIFVQAIAGATGGPHLYSDEAVEAKNENSYDIEFAPGEADVRLLFFDMDCVIEPAIFDKSGKAVAVTRTTDRDDMGCVSIARFNVEKQATYSIRVVNSSENDIEYAFSHN